MRFIIEEAENGGWAAFTQPEEYEPNKLHAVGPNLEELFSKLVTPTKQTHTLNQWAEMIVACDPYSDSPRKINMIKLLRAITGGGLKECKDAIERFL